MKYNFEQISPAQWLDIVNREEDVDHTEFKIRYVKIGDQHVAYSNTEVGKLLSPSFIRGEDTTDKELEKIFDKATQELEELYKQRKESQIKPSFMGGFSAGGK